MTDEKHKGRKSTGDIYADSFIGNLGLDFTDGEIEQLRLAKASRAHDMGLQRLHDQLVRVIS